MTREEVSRDRGLNWHGGIRPGEQGTDLSKFPEVWSMLLDAGVGGEGRRAPRFLAHAAGISGWEWGAAVGHWGRCSGGCSTCGLDKGLGLKRGRM